VTAVNIPKAAFFICELELVFEENWPTSLN